MKFTPKELGAFAGVLFIAGLTSGWTARHHSEVMGLIDHGTMNAIGNILQAALVIFLCAKVWRDIRETRRETKELREELIRARNSDK